MRLSHQRYEEIKRKIANFLEDYNVNEIPVDVFELARKMKIKIVFASEILKKHPEKVDEYILFNYPHSYLYYDSDNQQLIVYIDDIGCKRRRQRFSLAHEIIHIILGHTEQNKKNEAEANFGATYLLAPTSLALMKQNNGILLNLSSIEEVFDVSEAEAAIIYRYNENRLAYFDLSEKDYEKTINGLLGESFRNKVDIYNLS